MCAKESNASPLHTNPKNKQPANSLPFLTSLHTDVERGRWAGGERRPRSLHQSSKEQKINTATKELFLILFLITTRNKVKGVIAKRRMSSHTTTRHLTSHTSWHNPTIPHRATCHTHAYFLTSDTHKPLGSKNMLSPIHLQTHVTL